MRLAVLMVNTDESAFAKARSGDGEKFAALIARERPEWQLEVFTVIHGEFPEDPAGFDGLIITGSPASVHDDLPWITPLLALIRDAVAREVPIFGACFGHQAIAKALGGAVGANPEGWSFGRTTTQIRNRATWMTAEVEELSLYTAHLEQVTELPEGAVVLTGSAECPVGGFAIGSRVYTTQYHPEMEHEFITDLVEEYADKMDMDVIGRAQASLGQCADTGLIARWIVQFFESARSAGA